MSWKSRKRLEQYAREVLSYQGDPTLREVWNSESCAVCGARRDLHDVFEGPCEKTDCKGFVVRKPAASEER